MYGMLTLRYVCLSFILPLVFYFILYRFLLGLMQIYIRKGATFKLAVSSVSDLLYESIRLFYIDTFYFYPSLNYA